MARAVNGVKRRNLFDDKFLLSNEKEPVPKDGRVLENHRISVDENSSIKVRKKVLVPFVKFSRKEIKVWKCLLASCLLPIPIFLHGCKKIG